MNQVVRQVSLFSWFLYHETNRGIFYSPQQTNFQVLINTTGWREALWE